VPRDDATVDEALHQLGEAADSCDAGDDFVFYFSGHGILSRGSLVLLWHHTQWATRPSNTAIPISRIMAILDFCKASNKILILDCCHAGAAASALGLKSGRGVALQDAGVTANHLVLMASDRLESARELSSLGGSFMTTKLCHALTRPVEKVDLDDDGAISVQDLATWLARQASEYNRTYRADVPVPYLAGQLRGQFFFTQTTSWPAWKINLPNGTATLLPIGRRITTSHPFDRVTTVTAIFDNLVTNAEYSRFCSDKVSQPVGLDFVEGRWSGPFRPWDDPRFNDPSQPVVCISARACLRSRFIAIR